MRIKEVLNRAIIIIKDSNEKKAFDYFLKTADKSEIFFKRVVK